MNYYKGLNKDLVVMSRREAEEFNLNTPYVMISFCDPDKIFGNGTVKSPNIPENENRLGLLSQRFWDLDSRRIGFEEIFNMRMAMDIAEFILKYEDQIKVIAVHCEAGVSRSMGCAAGISYILNGDDSYFYEAGRPNALVRSNVIRAFNKLGRESFEEEPFKVT
jgi:predicted protein tyrosine phosphatase